MCSLQSVPSDFVNGDVRQVRLLRETQFAPPVQVGWNLGVAIPLNRSVMTVRKAGAESTTR